MKLICPSCQKELTVPDQYAGQVMKCPLCAGNFTAPTLPQAPSAPPPSPASAPAHTYGLAPEPIVPVTAPTPAPAPPRKKEPAAAPTPAADAGPPPVTGDYQHRRSCTINTRILPWVATVCLGIVFLLQFFPWLGFYPGGTGVASQNAWQVAFGSYTVDSEYKSAFPPAADEDKKFPAASILVIFYVLLFLLLLLLAIGSLVVGLMPINLPPPVQKVLPWRWTIVGGLALLTFLFLMLQLLAGFNFESELTEKIENKFNLKTLKGDERRQAEVLQGGMITSIQRTNWVRLALLFQFLAIAAAGLLSWTSHRIGRPLPRIDIQW